MANCKNFVKLINLYLDSEASEEQVKILFSHLQECPKCHQKLEEVKELHNSIKSIPAIKLPQGFHSQIMDSLQKASIKKSRLEVLRPAMSLIGIAVTAMLVMVIAWIIYNPKSAMANPEIHIVSPSKEAVIDKQYVDISAVFNDIDIRKIRVILDSKDVTEATEINQEFLIYTSDNLQSGYHIANIQIMDNKGVPVIQRSWAFYIMPSEPI